MLEPEFLAMLRCPKTGSELTALTAAAMDVFNRKLLAGDVCNELGQALTTPLEGLLVNAEQTMGFPIRDGIPDLVAGESIRLDTFETF